MKLLSVQYVPGRRAAQRVVLLRHYWQIALSGCLLVSPILYLPCKMAFGQSPDKASVESPTVKPEESVTTGPAAYHNLRIRGRVLWLAEALEKQFGISTVPEVAKNGLAILTQEGSLLPIVENLRGRAFRKDERLREMDLEILARQNEQQPFLQILRIFEVKGDERFEVDYWCDVCAIVMYEKGPCSCCQADNRLRKRLVADVDLK